MNIQTIVVDWPDEIERRIWGLLANIRYRAGKNEIIRFTERFVLEAYSVDPKKLREYIKNLEKNGFLKTDGTTLDCDQKNLLSTR